MRALLLLLAAQLAGAPRGAKAVVDLYESITEDVKARAVASLSPYEARQGLKLILGQRNGTLPKMMIHRDAAVESSIVRDFAVRVVGHDPLFQVGPGKSILCVGARLGGEVRAFTRLGALAIGIDFNPGVRNAWAVWGDATRLQFANNVFDFVYCNIVDHIDPRSKFFAEVQRVLKPGGKLLLYVDQNEPDAFSIHDNRGETLVKMRAEIKASGMSIAREETKGGGKNVRPLPQNWGGTVVFAAQK